MKVVDNVSALMLCLDGLRDVQKPCHYGQMKGQGADLPRCWSEQRDWIKTWKRQTYTSMCKKFRRHKPVR